MVGGNVVVVVVVVVVGASVVDDEASGGRMVRAVVVVVSASPPEHPAATKADAMTTATSREIFTARSVPRDRGYARHLGEVEYGGVVDTTALVAYVASGLAERADPVKAPQMAAYMYGTRFQRMYPDLQGRVPLYGVQKKGRTEVMRGLKREFPITARDEYRAAVTALWEQPHREEKYLAVGIATRHREYLTFDELPLLRRLIVEGAWWGFVDEVAARGVGHVLLHERALMGPEIDRWIDDPDMWIRRSALIAHLGHKEHTDEEQLFTHCLKRAHEKEFFIRKAIGWALRQYARTAPEAVRAFALEHRDQLSGLSFREATKHLDVPELA